MRFENCKSNPSITPDAVSVVFALVVTGLDTPEVLNLEPLAASDSVVICIPSARCTFSFAAIEISPRAPSEPDSRYNLTRGYIVSE